MTTSSKVSVIEAVDILVKKLSQKNLDGQLEIFIPIQELAGVITPDNVSAVTGLVCNALVNLVEETLFIGGHYDNTTNNGELIGVTLSGNNEALKNAGFTEGKPLILDYKVNDFTAPNRLTTGWLTYHSSRILKFLSTDWKDYSDDGTMYKSIVVKDGINIDSLSLACIVDGLIRSEKENLDKNALSMDNPKLGYRRKDFSHNYVLPESVEDFQLRIDKLLLPNLLKAAAPNQTIEQGFVERVSSTAVTK